MAEITARDVEAEACTRGIGDAICFKTTHRERCATLNELWWGLSVRHNGGSEFEFIGMRPTLPELLAMVQAKFPAKNVVKTGN